MLSLPTTTITTYRGTSTDDYGDETDTDTSYLEGVPASVLEQSRYVTQQSGATPMIVRTVTGRVGAGTDVQTNDRLLDEQTGIVYTVTAVSSVGNPMLQTDLRIDLKRVN